MKNPAHFSIRLINIFLIISICQLSSFVKPQNTSNFGNGTDRKTLLEIKTFLDGSPDEMLSSWNDSLHVCQWKGVTCGRRHQRVTVLSLSSMQLSGLLPPAIGNLSFLDTIDLSNNKLRGSIPKEIGRLSRLVRLDLSSNSMGGSIPVDLMNCSNLERINISHNNLIGSLPFQVGAFLKLSTFWVKGNQFTGGIPSSLGNISTLQRVSFSRNNFKGSIPDELGLLKNLTVLQFVDNNLSGSVPLALFNLSSIVEITLAKNHLSGNLPSNMGYSFPNLQYFTISGNQIAGTIPESISNISSLQKFDVSLNNLTGQVPKNLGVLLKNLTRFNVGHNGLGSQQSGDLQFLDSLVNATRLSELILVSNSFGGPFPISLFNMTQITRLLLGSNAISDHIPEAIGNLNNLVGLGIEQNDLIGSIPSSISQLHKLQELSLGTNKLSGPITFFDGNLSRLYKLGLENNRLNGRIPSAINNCSGLQMLELYQNQLTSFIPESVIGGLQQLTSLDLHQNLFSGPFPSEIGNLMQLNALSVSDNRFSGLIPSQLGNCFELQHLDMSRNFFEGGIPLSFGSLKSVSFVDLSHNNLSGGIPACLKSLPDLQKLNLSFNNLEGVVPNKGIFLNVTGLSIEGNKNLCGGISELHLPPCSNQMQKSPSFCQSKWIATLSFIFLALFLFAICRFLYWPEITRNNSSVTSSSALTYGPRLSYKELLDATDGFSLSNLIGVGSFGYVYKGRLPEEERPVAVKVLNLTRRGASKSFMSECGALGRIRHRNLLKILTTCSGVDFKGESFLALVYEYMPNGSLERWLHESGNLSFRQRLIIAIDVASALEYLHHDCETSVVHCDLKPGNVLLDRDMAARLGDFGLARLLCGSGSEVGTLSRYQTSFSETIGTVGYVAPEYGTGGKVSRQGDVYSYGILLLEIFTGKSPTDGVFRNGENLHSYVKSALPTQPKHIADSCLLKEFQESNNIISPQEQDVEAELLIRFADIASIGVACSVESPNQRMSIRDALVQLRTIQKAVQKLFESGEYSDGKYEKVLAFNHQ